MKSPVITETSLGRSQSAAHVVMNMISIQCAVSSSSSTPVLRAGPGPASICYMSKRARSSLCQSVVGPRATLVLPEGTVVLVAGSWVTASIEVDEDAGVIAAVAILDDSPNVATSTHFLIPGLIDTHVHVTATTADLAALSRLPPSYVAIAAIAELRASAQRGFTAVRDAGGADCGVARAASESLLGVCPRLLFSGRALSQTGGHGDFRGAGEACACACGGIGRVCDGVDECRRACRDELRKGAHAIKIMAGGGVASPTDRLEDTQFSESEISAIVEEAHAKHTYVFAHAYTPEAISRCVRLGVRSIEHGNQLDEASAHAMAKAGAYLSQTLITYVALRESGLANGMPAPLVAKVGKLVEQGSAAITLAQRHGVLITYGSDLLASMRPKQLQGFGLLLDAGLTPAEALATATSNAAALLGLDAGEIAVGKLCDLALLRVNPLDCDAMRALSEADVAGCWVGGARAK